MNKISFFIFMILSSHYAASQDINIRGYFQVDSIEIGFPFSYSLTVESPYNVTLLYPDSTYSFGLFEFHHKQVFPTKTENDISYDSVIYFLTSFEIDSIQKLKIPIFIVQGADCTFVYPQEDSVFLKSVVSNVPQEVMITKLPLKINTTYQSVIRQLNYFFIFIVGGGIVFLSIGLWIIFRKNIYRYFLLRKLTKKHNQFTREFKDMEHHIILNYSSDKVISVLVIWKKYMELLLKKSFTKYTSKEIFRCVNNKPLYITLQHIDKCIYDKKNYTNIEATLLSDLYCFAEDSFQNKIKGINNG